MKGRGFGLIAALSAYSATLILVELGSSQDYVRQYFTDIEGDVPFFAVNTTLSAFFLAGASLLLLFAATLHPQKFLSRSRIFLFSQSGIFMLLALDDRFQVHEALAYRIGVGDHFIMSFWAAMQMVILTFICRPKLVNFTAALLFVIATLFFVIMMIFDVFVPHDAVLRLSIEDLAKTWSAAFFLASAWSLARFHIASSERDKTLSDTIKTLQRLLPESHQAPKIKNSWDARETQS